MKGIFFITVSLLFAVILVGESIILCDSLRIFGKQTNQQIYISLY